MLRKQHYQLWLAIASILALLYWSWQTKSVVTPRALPQKPTSATDNSLNGGSYHEISILATPKDEYLTADYRIWIPHSSTIIRGLLVKQHGCSDKDGSKGLNHANDLQWQALALKHQFALVGTRLPTDYPMCSDKAIVDRAAKNSFLKAIAILAKKTRHKELNTVPWIIWGHSGGADWGTQMLADHPDRTIAIVNVHSGGILSTQGDSEILNLDSNSTIASGLIKTPILWFVGAKDPVVEEAVKLPQKIFYKFNQVNVLWALAIGPYTAHETGDTRLLAIPYLDAIATARLTDGNELLPLDPTKGWLGNIVTKKVVPAHKYKGDSAQTVWLPNEETALKWQQYVTSSEILPFNQPNAPTNVTVKDISPTKKIIRWNFTPDLQNGLPNFRIYRNNSLIQTLKGQSYDFGDVPNYTHVILEFRDFKASPDSVYTVAAFNQLGESMSLPATSSEDNEGNEAN